MAGLDPRDHDSWTYQYFHNQFTVTLLILALVSAAAFLLVPTTILDVLGFNLAKILTVENLVLATLPIPFAFVTIHSLRGFRQESFAAFSALLLVPFGGKLAFAGLTIAFGSPLTSWMAKNVYNGRNTFYTLYKATSTAVLVVAAIAGVLFILAYTATPAAQATLAGQVANQSTEMAANVFEESFGGGEETLQLSQNERVQVVEELVNGIESQVLEDMRRDGTFSQHQFTVIQDSFTAAKRDAVNQTEQEFQRVEQQLESGGAPTGTIRELVADNLQALTEPGPGTNIALFFIVFSLTLLIKLPFGVLGAFYAAAMLHFHEDAPTLRAFNKDT